MSLSHTDRHRLEMMQHIRLRELLGESNIVLHVDQEHRLHIACTCPAQVDRLLSDPIALLQHCWLVLGVEQVSMWFAQELIWRNDEPDPEFDCEPSLCFAQEQDALELIQFVSELEMVMPATQELPATETAARYSTSNRLPGQTLMGIAADVEQSIDEVRAWFASQGVSPIPFGSDEVVSGEDAIGAYAHFEPLVIRSRMMRRGLTLPNGEQNGNGTTATLDQPGEKSAPAKTAAAKKAAAKKTTAKKPATRKTPAKAKNVSESE